MFKIKDKKCPNTFCPPKKEHFCPLEKIELNTGSAYCRGHGVSEKFVSGPLGFNPLRTDVSPNDTKNHDILNKYNPLNDHHLKGWLSLATTRKLLYSQGLITSDGRVICNTKDYNVYKRNAQRRDNYIKEQQRERDDKQKQEQLQVFAANQNNRKELARKLKVLKAAVLADKLRNVSAHLRYFTSTSICFDGYRFIKA